MKEKLNEVLDFSRHSKAALALVFEIFLGVGTIIGSLLVFLSLANEIIQKEVIWFDGAITHIVYSFRNPLINEIMRWITFLGSGLFLGTALIIIISLLVWKKHRKDAAVFSFLFAFGAMLNAVLKSVFQRTRPDFLPLVFEPSYSFPSGHAMNACIFYTALAFFIFRKITNKLLSRILIGLSIVLILLIGMSRIYLGAHYPSDVLAGYAAGLIWFVVVVLFEKTLIFFRLFHQYELKKK